MGARGGQPSGGLRAVGTHSQAAITGFIQHLFLREIKTFYPPPPHTASVSGYLGRVNNTPRSQSCEVTHLSHRLPAEEGPVRVHLCQHLAMAVARSGSAGCPRNGEARLPADSAALRGGCGGPWWRPLRVLHSTSLLKLLGVQAPCTRLLGLLPLEPGRRGREVRGR